MASAVIFMQWDSYHGGGGNAPFFAQQRLTFNSRQERLHRLAAGDQLWLVSRCPEDHQYYFIGILHILDVKHNPPESAEGQAFGPFAVLADRSRSQNLGKRFAAEGLLRAFEFDTSKPIRYGSSIGQSLQTIRFLTASDEAVLAGALRRLSAEESPDLDAPAGLWTKCDGVFAEYFLTNWQQCRQTLAFLLYDPPPALRVGAPVFVHSDKSLRLVGTFRGSEFVAGHKLTVEAEERMTERERVWSSYRAGTIDPPAKSDFDSFWVAQNGVRSLFLFDNLVPVPNPVPFKVYGRALEWGYPMGVGYRYLSLSQSLLLLRVVNLPDEAHHGYVAALAEDDR